MSVDRGILSNCQARAPPLDNNDLGAFAALQNAICNRRRFWLANFDREFDRRGPHLILGHAHELGGNFDLALDVVGQALCGGERLLQGWGLDPGDPLAMAAR